MVFLGTSIRVFWRADRFSRQDRGIGTQLQPCHGDQNIRCWAIVLATAGGVDLHVISRKTWIFLVLSGIATGLSWLCYFRALQIGELSKVAPVDKLSVVMAMALGVLFLHERLTAREGIGGFFIAAGALILAWK
jgi:transporter family protein